MHAAHAAACVRCTPATAARRPAASCINVVSDLRRCAVVRSRAHSVPMPPCSCSGPSGRAACCCHQPQRGAARRRVPRCWARRRCARCAASPSRTPCTRSCEQPAQRLRARYALLAPLCAGRQEPAGVAIHARTTCSETGPRSGGLHCSARWHGSFSKEDACAGRAATTRAPQCGAPGPQGRRRAPAGPRLRRQHQQLVRCDTCRLDCGLCSGLALPCVDTTRSDKRSARCARAPVRPAHPCVSAERVDAAALRAVLWRCGVHQAAPQARRRRQRTDPGAPLGAAAWCRRAGGLTVSRVGALFVLRAGW
jgi:hypothetical protein